MSSLTSKSHNFKPMFNYIVVGWNGFGFEFERMNFCEKGSREGSLVLYLVP